MYCGYDLRGLVRGEGNKTSILCPECGELHDSARSVAIREFRSRCFLLLRMQLTTAVLTVGWGAAGRWWATAFAPGTRLEWLETETFNYVAVLLWTTGWLLSVASIALGVTSVSEVTRRGGLDGPALRFILLPFATLVIISVCTLVAHFRYWFYHLALAIS